MPTDVLASLKIGSTNRERFDVSYSTIRKVVLVLLKEKSLVPTLH